MLLCKQLEKHLRDMQIELENLAWDRKELQELIAQLEGEHDKAIAKVELLWLHFMYLFLTMPETIKYL